MIRSAITVSLVEEARGGPFVLWEGLGPAFETARTLGFDAVEIFAPGPDAVDREELRRLVDESGLSVAAVGTGAGMVKHGLSLSDPDPGQREKAAGFVREMIDFGAEFDCSAIIGSMQGRWGGDLDKSTALGYLQASLEQLGDYAASQNCVLIYEPLNRYESNLLNTLQETVAFLQTLATENVKLLADLFHMNIEETDMAAAIIEGGSHIGHIHFVDSNRRAAGMGHTDFDVVAAAIRQIGFEGYVSAEALPLPSSAVAAEQTIKKFRELFRN
ncbi:MAG: sugar phosphate isomerase/epimerase [Mariniblastus sp.]|nr:sugar phosphate isomerase/epimerase [Mariniblastus sp.]